MEAAVFEKLRKKISVGMLVVLLVLLVLYMICYFVGFKILLSRSTNSFLDEIAQGGGQQFWNEEEYIGYLTARRAGFSMLRSNRYFTPFFSAWVDEDGTVLNVVHRFFDGFTDDDAQVLVNVLLSKGRPRGEHRTLAYLVQRDDGRTLVVAVDRGNEEELEHLIIFVFLVMLVVSAAVLALFAWLYSRFATAPVEKAFKKQQQFISDASHELKTPIAVINANVSVLENDLPGNKWLGYIKDECARLNSLVHDMLFLAKTDEGRVELSLSEFDLNNAILCAVLPFESVAFEQKKRLEFDIAKEPLMVRGDEGRIKQAAIILTDNALKNSEEGSLIRVSVSQTQERCSFCVYNTGRGIPEQNLEDIFTRFYRVDKSRARQTGGYGLGLAIARAIAKEHGGRLTAQSREHEYAQFTFDLPRDQRPAFPTARLFARRKKSK